MQSWAFSPSCPSEEKREERGENVGLFLMQSDRRVKTLCAVFHL